ncbi:FecR domain-containing protein [Pedobacter sp. MC2016-24]|nr:FecR domain-containing protein [Pedobacter sp. MC2016-24]
MADQARVKVLLQQFADGNISQLEYMELMGVFKLNGNDDDVFAAMDEVWKNIHTEENYTDKDTEYFYQHLIGQDQFKVLKTKPVARKLWSRIAVAAAVLLIFSTAGYLIDARYFSDTPARIANTAKDIPAGKNSAVLTLSDGKVIDLNTTPAGAVLSESGMQVVKAKDGQLVYRVQSGATGNVGQQALNTISTPKGGQYQVNLPDGTRVWLNAASSMKFPVQFSRKERRILLNGEAYFEVAKDKLHPFVVETAKQAVEVLGTHFNISGYASDELTRTTLLEGSVHVLDLERNSAALTLKPGQQSEMISGRWKVSEVNAEEAVAWKNGTFLFTGQSLEEIMKQVERWYDVDVVFEDKALRKQAFRGTISRFKNISQLLQVLESTGSVHFKVDGRRIRAMQ